MTPLARELTHRVLTAALGPAPVDNVDPERFPDGMPEVGPATSSDRLENLLDHGGDLDWLADRLPASDRELLLSKLVFHVLGARHARVGPSRAQVDALLAQARELAVEREVTAVPFAGSAATHRFDLRALGVPATVETYTLGLQGTFQLQQYRAPAQPAARPRPGDVAIDAGGCFGETALWLAHVTGPGGRVITLELEPANLTILRGNLDRNPDLGARVTVVEAALWSHGGKRVAIDRAGPAATVAHATGRRPSDDTGAQTVTLDDLVADHELDSVDFVKMDIEGAEPAALAGATATLGAHRPRLALAVYHDIAHVWELARALDALGLGYRFALGHFTMHDEETVLYAWPDPERR